MEKINKLEIKTYSRDTAQGYFINAVISARIDTGFRSNSFGLDEDVNMYLANLLTGFASEGRSAADNSIFLYESDLVAKQEEVYDLRDRFNLYKQSADFLLIKLGIFGGINSALPEYKRAFRLEDEVYIGRARAYFSQASEYAAKLRRGASGLSEVLRKLSDHFVVYLNVLYQVREKYFSFTERFSDGEWFHFVHKNIIHHKGVDSKVYVELMDDFLARLTAWKRDHLSSDKDMLRILWAELKRLNPKFDFDVETLFTVSCTVNAA